LPAVAAELTVSNSIKHSFDVCDFGPVL